MSRWKVEVMNLNIWSLLQFFACLFGVYSKWGQRRKLIDGCFIDVAFGDAAELGGGADGVGEGEVVFVLEPEDVLFFREGREIKGAGVDQNDAFAFDGGEVSEEGGGCSFDKLFVEFGEFSRDADFAVWIVVCNELECFEQAVGCFIED